MNLYQDVFFRGLDLLRGRHTIERLRSLRRSQHWDPAKLRRWQLQRLNALLAEINGFGCELKGLGEGLIDFPSKREGRTVYLCWKLGEERIAYWHELDTGFASREPL